MSLNSSRELSIWLISDFISALAPFFLLLNLYQDMINANVAEAIAPTIAPIIDRL